MVFKGFSRVIVIIIIHNFVMHIIWFIDGSLQNKMLGAENPQEALIHKDKSSKKNFKNKI
jgi:hypothetical protein